MQVADVLRGREAEVKVEDTLQFMASALTSCSSKFSRMDLGDVPYKTQTDIRLPHSKLRE
ncbi:hypothetical protein E2C01_042719 [Portunus trituberculatus]|uniref:Uncharacterized protein n=1 Tax=Portunus trituberculatus TaxID=210409 RepID=A0A5B7FQZ1_PORTR|nr:hypothetical protein [Portunus trituberculatus]